MSNLSFPKRIKNEAPKEAQAFGYFHVGTKPLVTIITPTTADRAAFMDKLLHMVAAQDYPNIEHLIIEDAGTVGAKRNMGCERAGGEIILHMDSDDQYAADWVSKSVDALLSSGADVVGLGCAYFYCKDNGKTYKYSGDDNYVMGATMCYRKSFWERNPFKDMQVGEDNKFIMGCKVYDHGYIDGFLSILHNSNTSAKNLRDRRWSEVK